MACCLCSFQISKTWLAFLVPIFAVFARFSSYPGSLLVSITLSVLLILLSTLFLTTFSRQKPIMVQKEAPRTENDQFSPQEEHKQPHEVLQENSPISSTDCSVDDVGEVPSVQEKTDKAAVVEDNRRGFLIRSQDLLYSESESMDQYSSTSSEEDHSSDIEWPYNMGQRLDCSDDSISDEESLIEIAIPSGQFVSPDKDYPNKFNLKSCKLSHQEALFQKDFLADINDMNEEDNLIEIDIYMGSIKCDIN